MTAGFAIAVALAMQQPTVPIPGAPSPMAAVWTDDRPLTRMLQNLGQDLVAFPRPVTLAIVGAGALGAGISFKADDRLSAWVHEVGGTSSYTPIGSLLGNQWLQGGAAIATYAIGVAQKSPELTHMGGDLIRAQVLNGVFTVGVKAATSRARPNGSNSASFPSGHTSATFASATVLAEHYGWKVGLPAFAVAGFIGWTRVRDDQHYLSDVVFGSAIGIASGRTVAHGHKLRRFSVVPVVMPGGGAIYVMRK